MTKKDKLLNIILYAPLILIPIFVTIMVVVFSNNFLEKKKKINKVFVNELINIKKEEIRKEALIINEYYNLIKQEQIEKQKSLMLKKINNLDKNKDKIVIFDNNGIKKIDKTSFFKNKISKHELCFIRNNNNGFLVKKNKILYIKKIEHNKGLKGLEEEISKKEILKKLKKFRNSFIKINKDNIILLYDNNIISENKNQTKIINIKISNGDYKNIKINNTNFLVYVIKSNDNNLIIYNLINIENLKKKYEIKINNKTKFYTNEIKNIIWIVLIIMILSIILSTYVNSKLKKYYSIYEKEIHLKENQLKNFNEKLEKEVKNRTKALKTAQKELEKLARTDALTGLNNRYALIENANREIEVSKRYNLNLSIIMFDIDFFKNINDVYGHDIGDSILIELSKLIKKNIRKTDFLSRYGGEEFIIILPNTDIIEATKLANKLKEIVENYKFPIIKKLTISIGVAQLDKSKNENIDDLFKKVDKLLYKAKENGRNKVFSENSK
jgi:diguanylate cyclase (GGDEF)-like protein